MRLQDGRALALRALEAIGYTPQDSEIIANHLLDCELRGLSFSGLARILSIAERVKRTGLGHPPTVVTDHHNAAAIDGGDSIGYLVSRFSMQVAIEKASATGLATIGANGTWYTGMLSYYGEMAADAGFVALIASNTAHWVAPAGGTAPAFGTNPICFAFPSTNGPVIWDIGTSNIIHAQAVLADREGAKLPRGSAFDSAGAPTVDPLEALAGAFTPWGGHKGAGLGLVVQMLGMLAGAPVQPDGLKDFGFFTILVDPALFGDPAEFQTKITRYAEFVRDSRPLADAAPVRMPFDRSRAERERRIKEGRIDVSPSIVDALARLVAEQKS